MRVGGVSPITTHVLDIAVGRPAGGVPVELLRKDPGSLTWERIGSGVTNSNGRLTDLLPPSATIPAAKYRWDLNSGGT